MLNNEGRRRTEKRPSLGSGGRVTDIKTSARAATPATLRKVIRQPSRSPTALPSGRPTIMATALPVAIVLRAIALCPDGTMRTAIGDTILQKTEWQHATPTRLAISMA